MADDYKLGIYEKALPADLSWEERLDVARQGGFDYLEMSVDETDARLGLISIDSPLARAVLKKRIDDDFEAQLPDGPQRFFIVAVEYAV